MDVTATLDAPHPPEAVFAWVADLDRYPAWLDIVPKASADGEGEAQRLRNIGAFAEHGPGQQQRRDGSDRADDGKLLRAGASQADAQQEGGRHRAENGEDQPVAIDRGRQVEHSGGRPRRD